MQSYVRNSAVLKKINNPLPRSLQQCLNLHSISNRFGVTFHRATLQSQLRQVWEISLLHTNITQVLWQFHLANEFVNSFHDFLCCRLITNVGTRFIEPNSHSFSSLSQLIGSCIQVETHSMWYYDSIGNTMRYTCCSTLYMADSMMQCNRYMSEC